MCMFMKITLLTTVLSINHASPIQMQVSQPRAVTPGPLHPDQLDYFVKNYQYPLPPDYNQGAPQFSLPDPEKDKFRADLNIPISADTKQNPTYYYDNRGGGGGAGYGGGGLTAQNRPVTPFHPPLVHNDGYDFYFPQPINAEQYNEKDLYLMEMQPPSAQLNAPDYYTEKPKKGTKKYSPIKKHVNYRNVEKETLTSTSASPRVYDNGDGYIFEDYFSEQLQLPKDYQTTSYRRSERVTPMSSIKTLRQEDLNTGEYFPSDYKELIEEAANVNKKPVTGASIKKKKLAPKLKETNTNSKSETAKPKPQRKSDEPLEGSSSNTSGSIPDNDERVEFQMHGFNGPNSYKFGFDTGKGENRQFRVEQRDKEGNVEGQYGYYDRMGKFNIVKYTSKLNEGFKAEKANLF